MAAQGERELGDIVMGEGLLDPMAQEEEIEQEMLVVEGEQLIPPQMDPEPEMGAVAAEATVDDTSPSPPHQNPPPIPAETVQQSEFDMFLQAINRMNEKMGANMREEIKNNTSQMKEEARGMREEMKEMRGEMQNMGVGLQDKLTEVKDEMKGEINTVWTEINKLEKNVESMGDAMEAGKEEMAKEIRMVVGEIDKVGNGLKKVKEGQDQIKGENI